VSAQSVGLGIAEPDASAMLDMTSTTKGLLVPRMNSSNIHSIPVPAKGLLVYDSVKNELMVNMGTSATPDWQPIAANNVWGLTGNSHTDSAVNFLGTTDDQPLHFRINDQWAGMIDSASNSTYMGYGSGRNGAGTLGNTAYGFKALEQNAAGNYNTALGVQTLSVNANGTDIGSYNTAVGYQALMNNPGTIANTAVGYQALFNNSTGFNTAIGYQALYNGGGGSNTATGAQALFNGGGNSNTAIGSKALYNNAASFNTASGYEALFTNVSGSSNTAAGYQAMRSNYSGQYNAAFGSGALYANSYGSYNTAIGFNTLANTTGSDGNTALGYNAGATYDNGYYNCFIGSETDANGAGYYNCIALGHGTIVTAPSMMSVGNGATGSIGGQVGWSTISDGRVKRNIQENIPGLDFIMKLRPISYTIDLAAVDAIVQPPGQKSGTGLLGEGSAQPMATAKPFSPQMIAARKAKEQIVYTGFAAQEVEQAAQSLHYNFSGVDAARNDKDLYSLRYGAFVVPLTKAVQELSARNDRLEKENELLTKQSQQIRKRIAILKQKMN
jgi:hypothetical protein